MRIVELLLSRSGFLRQIYVLPICSSLWCDSDREKFTIAKYPSASRKFSHEYGTMRAPEAEMMRIFLDSSRLSAQAVRTMPFSLIPKESGVFSRLGSKNCQLIILNGFVLSESVTSESFFLAKSGSPVTSSYPRISRIDSRRAHPARSISCTQRLTRSYAESLVFFPAKSVFHVRLTFAKLQGWLGMRFFFRSERL